MHIKNPTAPCICCYTTLWNINVSKKALNDKLQGSVATYLRCGGIVNNQIKKGLLLSLSEKKLKSVNIWRSYKQERYCFVHFLSLLAVCWPSAQVHETSGVFRAGHWAMAPPLAWTQNFFEHIEPKKI